MTATNFSLSQRRGTALLGAPNVIFWMLILGFLPTAVFIGGTQYLLIALAAGLGVIAWQRPKEAVGAGILFLFAAGIVLPYGARMDPTGPTWQMYYWAVGLLLITVAAVLRIGLRRTWDIPRSAKALVFVSLLAALYGITHGVSAGYVLRQLYGALLLVAYLAIALHVGEQELLLRRIKSFGLLCAILFFVYYAAVFGQYGFHKEMGFNGEQACFLATILFIAGGERRKRSWVLAATALLLVPILIFMRRDILTFLFALAVAISMKVKSRVSVAVCCAAMVLIALPALYPPITEVVATELRQVPVVGQLLPPGVRDAGTLIERGVQLEATLETVRTHPWFGAGMGGDLEMVNPANGELYIGAYEDNGWGYLLQKMGVVGAAAFLWFLATIFRSLSRDSIALSACLVAATFVTMFSEPVFLHFTTAPFLGAYAGLLIARKRRQRFLNSPVAGVTALAGS